jgi:hypothetical protein
VEAHRVVRCRGSHISLDNQLTDGGEIVSLTRRPPFNARKIPGTHFCQRLSRPQRHNVVGRMMSNDLIGNRTRDLPAGSIVPQPTTLPRAPLNSGYTHKKQFWMYDHRSVRRRVTYALHARWTLMLQSISGCV